MNRRAVHSQEQQYHTILDMYSALLNLFLELLKPSHATSEDMPLLSPFPILFYLSHKPFTWSLDAKCRDEASLVTLINNSSFRLTVKVTLRTNSPFIVRVFPRYVLSSLVVCFNEKPVSPSLFPVTQSWISQKCSYKQNLQSPESPKWFFLISFLSEYNWMSPTNDFSGSFWCSSHNSQICAAHKNLIFFWSR